MQRAIVAALMLALATGYLGTFVVQRRLSFLGDGLAHAAFGGVALGLLLGTQPILVAFPFTVLAAIAIVWSRQRTGLSSDTSIGVFFAVSVSLGVVFLSLKSGYTGDAMAYLFGSLLLVTVPDIGVAALLLVACGASLLWWGQWSLAGCDREIAQTDGLSPSRDDYLLTILLAVAIVASVKLVGAILTSAFLVIPAAAARMMSRTFYQMAWLSVSVSMVGTVAGLVASFYLDVPTGPAIVLCHAAVFAAVAVFSRRDR